ncbi:MAG: M20/M25/M40 family metallo-hydrolase [bacterium]|nr:M20/M25/M40 family metallo-hydrolase [bacterium]
MRNLFIVLLLIPVFVCAGDLLVSFPLDIRAVEDEAWLDEITVLIVGKDYIIGLTDEASIDSVPAYSILDVYDGNKEYVKVFPSSDIGEAKARMLGPVIFERDGFLLIEFYGDYPPGFDTQGIINIIPLRTEPIKYKSDSKLPPFQYKNDVEDIVASVDEASYKGYIQDLEDFVTRNGSTDEYYDACLYVKAKFEEYGYTAELDEFYVYYYGKNCWNVVAEKPGVVDPDVIYLITSHLDSTVGEPWVEEPVAPGADDNASGSANVLEAARVMKDYDFENTVRFVCFGAEEIGLFGSEHYAENAYNNDENIQGVVNLDMIIYAPQSYETLWVPYDNTSQDLAEYYETSAATYVPDLSVDIEYSPGTTYSDHSSFWQYGFAAILGIEEAVFLNPYFHTVDDLLANYLAYFPFGTNVAKASIATLASLAVPYGGSGADDEGDSNNPAAFALFQSTPNPCRGSAEVAFSLPEVLTVNLSVYDTKGRKVSTLIDGELPEGEHSVIISGLTAGIYLYSIEAGEYYEVKKMVVSE